MKNKWYIFLAAIGLTSIIIVSTIVWQCLSEAKKEIPKRREIIPLVEPIQANGIPKVELVQPISINTSQDMQKVDLIEKETIHVSNSFAQKLYNVNPIQVPKILGVALETAQISDIPKILAIALEHVDKVNCPEIAAITYANLIRLSSDKISKKQTVELQKEWYQKFNAKNGSRLWWILKLAKEKAEAGESVEDLKKLFDETMQKWLEEEEEDDEP